MTSKRKRGDDALSPDIRDALLESIAPVAPPTALRAKVLARVRADSATYVTVRGGVSGWRELTPGLEFKILLGDTPNQSKSFLLRVAAGTRMPEHNHRAFEECLVLEGDFMLGEIKLSAGDFHCAAKNALHGETYTERGVTVYLRASIDDYPGVAL